MKKCKKTASTEFRVGVAGNKVVSPEFIWMHFEIQDENHDKHMGGKSRMKIQRKLILLAELSEKRPPPHFRSIFVFVPPQ